MTTTHLTLPKRVAIVIWGLPLVLMALSTLYLLTTTRRVSGSHSGPSILGAIDLVYLAAIPLLVFWALNRIIRWLQESEQVERQTLARECRLAAILSTQADAILSVDRDSRIETWNLGAEWLLGFTAEEITGKPLAALLRGGPAAEVEVRWLAETVKQAGLVRRHETACRDVSGRMIDVEMTATLVTDAEDKPSGMSVILRDITNRKRREEENQRLNAILNEQADERARELAENVGQLAQANAELHQLDETRSEFVSVVSHQIRAPLTNMGGAVQLMQADCQAVNATCARMFAILEQQVSRLDRLVQDVLSAARLEAGELPFQCEPISVMPVLRQAAEQFRARLRSRPIHLTDKPGLPLVYADRDRVSEILANLLDNAGKYSPPGQEIQIEVRADQSEVTISARDFGPGLPPGDLGRVFDKFYRADSTDAQTAYGYGLGLYVCRRLVEAQSGRIWAENHPAGGAVFSFTLPVWQG